MRSLREALLAIRRAPLLSALSALAIAFSLLILGLFGLAAHNIDRSLAHVEERVEVVAYLATDTDPEAVRLARTEISRFPEVADVRYVSRVEALREATREMPEFSDVFSALDVNPLPASLEIRLTPPARNPEGTSAVAERVAAYSFVDEVRYGREWVERLHSLRRVAGASAALLGGAFAFAAVLLVGSTVRMAILARREEIRVMESVGATDAFIRRPFLVEGLMTGLGGGLVALGLLYGLYTMADRTFLRLAWLPDLWIVLGLALGAVLGMLAAARSVRKEISAHRAV